MLTPSLTILTMILLNNNFISFLRPLDGIFAQTMINSITPQPRMPHNGFTLFFKTDTRFSSTPEILTAQSQPTVLNNGSMSSTGLLLKYGDHTISQTCTVSKLLVTLKSAALSPSQQYTVLAIWRPNSRDSQLITQSSISLTIRNFETSFVCLNNNYLFSNNTFFIIFYDC